MHHDSGITDCYGHEAARRSEVPRKVVGVNFTVPDAADSWDHKPGIENILVTSSLGIVHVGVERGG
jgi:hypothetical protein